MHYPRILTLSIVYLAAVTTAAAAQTLSARPAFFLDPVLSTDPSRGELVLGRTTLTTALRIFAVELEDSVRLPLRHSSNPDTVSSSLRLPGVPELLLRHRLELGPSLYTLYFDRHERLVAAVTLSPQRRLRRDELVARYPTLRVQQVSRTAEGAWLSDDLVAPLGPCVALIARVWRMDKGTVGSFGYAFTCPTRPISPARE